MTAPEVWLDPGFGASGDMVLGTLVGLGAPVEALRADLATLDIDGWAIDAHPVTRGGIMATRVAVEVPDNDHHHRPWSTIDSLLATSDLPAEVAEGARATFERLGRTEAEMHGVALDEVHFHEVGAIDAIVDIVGAWSALHHLGATAVSAGPVGLGSGGTVDTAHGTLPVPAPATLALLAGVPVRGLATPAETVTPTGAALLVTMVERWGPMPTGRLVASSRGAGGRDPDSHPNVITGTLVEPVPVAGLPVRPSPEAPTSTRFAEGTSSGAASVSTTVTVTEAVVLATNVDDTTPEVLGQTIDRLLAAGADDAWLIPIGMKKNRPGVELRVLAPLERAPELRQIVFSETGTLGLRAEPVTKYALDRRSTTIEVAGCAVRVKVGPHGAKPEHDDLLVVAAATGRPVRQLAAEAHRAILRAGLGPTSS